MSQLSDFINHIKKFNIARMNRYRVVFALPIAIKDANAQKVISLTCLMADVPGYQEQTTSNAYGNLPRKIVFGKSQSDFTTTFLVTGNFDEKKLFDEWHAAVMNESNTSFQYYDNYISHITVDCMNEQDQVVYSFSLTEAFPIHIGQLKLDRASQNQQMVLDVTWAYHKIKTDEDNMINRSSTINPIISNGGGVDKVKRLVSIPGLDSFSAGVHSAMDTVNGFRDHLQGALKTANDVRDQIRDFKMSVVDGVKVLNGVVKDIRAISNIPLDVKNEVVNTLTATKNQIGYLKDDAKLIVSPFPKR